jgi:parallel beta-helix repeat protein
VRITWNSVSGASYYQVYRAESSRGTKTALGSWETGASYDDTLATPGTIYYYWVKAATNSGGSRPSDYSSYDTGWRAGGGPIWYVDVAVTGTNDGTSWTNAYNCLQDALAAAGSGDEIWVAEGTYKPDQGGSVTYGDREATFLLKNGVALYGGFAGGETSRDQRDSATNVTILSGDLDGDDVDVDDPCDLLDEPTRAENSYHVVTDSGTDATAIFDGFTITAGNANGPLFDGDGGGMYNYGSGSPTLINCTFSDNSADYGGGMRNDNSSPTLTNCTFSENSANSGGGGMCNYESSPTLINCTFSGNSADYGGGMRNDNSSPTLTNCTFSENSANSGGGMDNYESNPTLTNCIFSGNSAVSGGGMDNYGGSDPTLTNCIFSGNSAGVYGGGMCNSTGSPTVTNCTFSGNSSEYYGGGMYNDLGSPTLTNCTFSGNSSEYYGGGMWNGHSSPTLTNCILWDNTAEYQGPQISLYDNSTLSISYCDLQGGQTEVYDDGTNTINWGSGNIDDDPLFVRNPDDGGDGWGTGDNDDFGDLRLQAGSPCIDAGDNDAVPAGVTTDLDGNPRFVDDPDTVDTGNGTPPIVDMGAYEFGAWINDTPVYRFWSPVNSRHFYTIKEAEKDKLINIYAHVWTYESIAYYAFETDSEPGLVPVYRFWSPVLVAHFYTTSESERDKLINIYPHVWTYEGIAFYAYPEGQQPVDTLPVYRFWSGTLETHFYTIDETEKNKLIDNYSHVWTYESVAWYAYE